MKTFFILAVIFFSFFVTGCNSGNVSVTDKANATASNNPTSADATKTPSVITDSRTSHEATRKHISFERVMSSRGNIDAIIAISFASSQSKSKVPFGLSLRTPRTFRSSSIFGADLKQVVYLRSNGNDSDSLVSATLRNMKSTIISQFPKSVASFAFNKEQNKIAWIDFLGKVYVATLQGNPLVLPSSAIASVKAKSLQWDPLGRFLAVYTEKGDVQFYSDSDKGYVLTSHREDLTAFAIDRGGSLVAFVKKDGSVSIEALPLSKASKNGSKETPFIKLESSEVYDLVWSNESILTYWVRLTSGIQEVRYLNLLNVEEESIALLNLPGSIGNGVVCPVLRDDILYFANYSDGQYVIERYSAPSQIETIAIPPATDEGFICPQVASDKGL